MLKISGVDRENIMSFEDFYESVFFGDFTDYDGYGYFCDGENVYEEPSLCCDTQYLNKFRGKFSKVVWFNR